MTFDNNALFVPLILTLIILCGTVFELVFLVNEGITLSIYGEPVLDNLCFALLVWTLFYTLKIMLQLKIKKVDKLFWIWLALIPLLFLAALTLL